MAAASRAQSLAATLLAADTPSSITSAISAVSSFLLLHPHDLRPFFSHVLPPLVLRLFGFNDTPAWIENPALSSPLLALLSPTSPLLAAVSSPSASLRYFFPLERLPVWLRHLLQNNYDISITHLCPLLPGRVKYDDLTSTYQLQLNVFEYFFFWFAYYPVCKGNSEGGDTAGIVTKPREFRVRNWTVPIPLSAAVRRTAESSGSGIYLKLLYGYLKVFVPKCGVGAYQPYRSSLLSYGMGVDDTAFRQAEFLVYSLVHFWLVDNDFSPLPVSVCRSFGVVLGGCGVVGETPPTSGLGDAVKVLVKYLNCGLVGTAEGSEQKVFDRSPVRKGLGSEDVGMVLLENSFGAWNAVLQRPLYRYILRTFLFCPMGASIKNAEQVFSVWLVYITPWKTTTDDFLEFEMDNPSSQSKSKEGKEGSEREPVYEPIWQGYVLSNYPFYSSLVAHFLGFALKLLPTNSESTIQMVSKLLDILTSSKDMLDLLQNVDAAYQSKQARPSTSYHDSLYKYVPSIREQLRDWEDGLCASKADGAFLHENWNLDLKLFSDAEQGPRKLLQLFVLRAEHEIQSINADATQNLQALDSIRSQMKILFGVPVGDPQLPDSPERVQVHDEGRLDVFTPKHPRFGKRKWADLKYKGDWMRRPISDTEVAWLASALIGLSDWLNRYLGLDRVEIAEVTAPVVVNVVSQETEQVGGPKEILFMVVGFLSSSLVSLCHWVLKFMRRRRMRINLRWLASKNVVMVLFTFAAILALRKAFLAVLPISGRV